MVGVFAYFCILFDGNSSAPLTFEGGKRYTLRLHLDMNSVKLDADVGEAWEEGTV